MATAGRTVLFSAIIVALSMAMMVLFPMYFLKSFAYAGVATVAFAARCRHRRDARRARAARRSDRCARRRRLRSPHACGAADPRPQPVEQTVLVPLDEVVMRHAVPIGLAVVALLLLLGAPFLGVQVGLPRRPGAAHLGVGASGR